MSEVEPVTVGQRSTYFGKAFSIDDSPPTHQHRRHQVPIRYAEPARDEPPLPPHCEGREHLYIELRRGVCCLWCGKGER